VEAEEALDLLAARGGEQKVCAIGQLTLKPGAGAVNAGAVKEVAVLETGAGDLSHDVDVRCRMLTRQERKIENVRLKIYDAA